jgi:hypothetical protein
MILGVPLILFFLYLNYSSNKDIEKTKSVFAYNNIDIDNYITGCLIYQCSKGVRNNVYLKCNNKYGVIIMNIICLDDSNRLEYFNEFKFLPGKIKVDSSKSIKGEDNLDGTYKYEKHIIKGVDGGKHRFLFRVERRHIDSSSSRDFIKYINQQNVI